MSYAFVFPGQGSQSPGMLDALAAEYPVVRESLQEAGEVLGLDLAGLVASGPEAELNRTELTQPALLAAGVATWRAWQAAGGRPPVRLAGHSLGEYTALVCAGCLSFADALRLVRRRGELMQQAVASGEGAMAAILGLDDDAVREACSGAADGDVVAAVNFNAPGQVVIAGQRAAVERAAEAAKAAGARRVVPLPVSVPSHCALMRPAAEALAPALEAVSWKAPAIPVVNNVDVAIEDDPARIREALVRQLYNPVRWVETIQALSAAGVTDIVECGPGKVLAGLTRRIDRSLGMHALVDPASITATLEATGPGQGETRS